MLCAGPGIKTQTCLRQCLLLFCRQRRIALQRGKKLTDAVGIIGDKTVFLLTVVVELNRLHLQRCHLPGERAGCVLCLCRRVRPDINVIPLRVISKIEVARAGDIRWHRLDGHSKRLCLTQQAQQVIARIIIGRQNRVAFQQAAFVAPRAVCHIKRGECLRGARQ